MGNFNDESAMKAWRASQQTAMRDEALRRWASRELDAAEAQRRPRDHHPIITHTLHEDKQDNDPLGLGAIFWKV